MAADVTRLIVLFQQEIAYQRHILPFYDLSPKFDWRRFVEVKLNNPNERLFVADEDGIVVGYIDVRMFRPARFRALRNMANRYLLREPPISFVPSRSVGRIEDCYVQSRLRRRGIGSALLTEGLEWLRSKGATAVELAVAKANESGKAFWEKHGFSPYRLLMSKTME
jgi:ribosomal protein S18 acetylase RimI-like enzyme